VIKQKENIMDIKVENKPVTNNPLFEALNSVRREKKLSIEKKTEDLALHKIKNQDLKEVYSK
jgi:hypothetical protein